jgi:lipopolysaccharide export system permease protein
MVIAGRIQRYVFRQSVMSLLMTLGVIVLTIVLVDVVEQMRTVGARTQISVLTAFRLTLLKTPGLLMETLPFAILVGAILSYMQLSRRSEISPIRAAGMSAWRFLAPIGFLAAATGVLMVTVIDPLATYSQQQYQRERRILLNQTATPNTDGDGVWLSQGDLAAGADTDPNATEIDSSPDAQAIIHARRVIGRGEALEDVTFYYFAPGPGGPNDRVFTRRIDARQAKLVSGFWQLKGVVENRFGGAVSRTDTLAVPTNLRSDTLLSRFASSQTISFWDLGAFIDENRLAGMDVDAYVLKYHTLLATPVLMVAMALIGAVVCLRLARSGGLTRLMAAGTVSGFVLYFVNRVSAGLSGTGAAPPEAAAWCPPLFALFAVLAILAHNEDG